MLSFGDELEEDESSDLKLSIGETTTKRFKEAPPPPTMMPAIGLEVLSSVNRSNPNTPTVVSVPIFAPLFHL